MSQARGPVKSEPNNCMVVTFDFVFVSGLFLGLGLGYCFGLLVDHDWKNSS